MSVDHAAFPRIPEYLASFDRLFIPSYRDRLDSNVTALQEQLLRSETQPKHRVNPNESTGDNQCLYSYAVYEEHNELTVCTSPMLRVLIQGNSRDANVALDDGEWHHVCFTWNGKNGDYVFYKDGVSVDKGTGLNMGGKVTSGGTTVIGQDQDEVGGGFVAAQAFVGDVTEVNLWGTVLSKSDVVGQATHCHITQGSVNWWSQFRAGIHGGVQIWDP